MTKRFRVLVRQDAWLNHYANIEADTAEEACEAAEHAWKNEDDTIKFKEDDLSTFYDILVDPDEAYEVDKSGAPVE